MSTDKKTNWIIWLIVGLCALAIPVGLLGKAAKKDSDTGGASESSGDWSLKFKDRIKVIQLTGMIVDNEDEGLFSVANSTESTIKKIRKATENKKIKAVLLRINSPGGTVATSQELNEAVLELKKSKPVYASMGDLAASGGYYVACACDKIYANPGTLTGSIGVIFNGMNFKGLADKLGVTPQVIKSGLFKDIASPYRPMTDEEKKILQDLINDSYDQFVTAVSTGRKMKVEDVKRIADGRIYSGRQAKKLGLIDELGSYQVALKALQSECKAKYNLDHDLPVEEKSSSSLLETLLDTSSMEGRSWIESLAQFAANQKSAGLADQVLPLSLRARFYNQPMWMMQ